MYLLLIIPQDPHGGKCIDFWIFICPYASEMNNTHKPVLKLSVCPEAGAILCSTVDSLVHSYIYNTFPATRNLAPC